MTTETYKNQLNQFYEIADDQLDQPEVEKAPLSCLKPSAILKKKP